MLIQFECGNVACYRPTLVNAASRVKSFIGVETGIIILSSAQYNDAAKQVSASSARSGQAFFSHSACKVVSAAARTAPQRHGLPRIDTTCAPASRMTRDVALVDASATPIISYRLFARANPSCGSSSTSLNAERSTIARQSSRGGCASRAS